MLKDFLVKVFLFELAFLTITTCTYIAIVKGVAILLFVPVLIIGYLFVSAREWKL